MVWVTESAAEISATNSKNDSDQIACLNVSAREAYECPWHLATSFAPDTPGHEETEIGRPYQQGSCPYSAIKGSMVDNTLFGCIFEALEAGH